MTYQAKTASQWMQIVLDNQDDLRQLVADYHPSARYPQAYKRTAVQFTDGDVVAVDAEQLPITAPNAERACQEVRQMIRKERPDDPLAKWDKAVANADVGMINSLLNDAWFGVPESTSCWGIPGFGIACDLMDDLPEENEKENN